MNTLKIAIFFSLVVFAACSELREGAHHDSSDIDSRKTMDDEHQKVFDELKTKDSLLFQQGFNHCDTSQVRALTSDDFEFYHNQSGITNSKEAFIQSILGLCALPYRATRELNEKSLEVHLLKKDGELYGAIQEGEHQFFAKEANQPKYLTSTANFTHLWILENHQWKLKRVLSFNHQEVN